MEPCPVTTAKKSPEETGACQSGLFAAHRSVVAYAGTWPDPEATERLALSQALKLLPEIPSVRYFAFPWASLIDRLQSGHPDGDCLRKALAEATDLLAGSRVIVTVCEHRDLLKHQELFAETGITHLFWPHIGVGQDCLPSHRHIRLRSFPAAPLTTPEAGPPQTERTHLLASRGTVSPAPGDAWPHLQDSSFALCSEPDPAWLWTAVACETIPVFPETIPPLPGNMALWETAAICCSPEQDAFRELPAQLENTADNTPLLELKRRALRQLGFLYGADCFIYDILKLFISQAETVAEAPLARPGFSYGQLLGLAAQVARGGETGATGCADVFALGCCSRMLANPATFYRHYRENPEFRRAFRKAMVTCSAPKRELLHQALALKGLALRGHKAAAPGRDAKPC